MVIVRLMMVTVWPVNAAMPWQPNPGRTLVTTTPSEWGLTSTVLIEKKCRSANGTGTVGYSMYHIYGVRNLHLLHLCAAEQTPRKKSPRARQAPSAVCVLGNWPHNTLLHQHFFDPRETAVPIVAQGSHPDSAEQRGALPVISLSYDSAFSP